MAQTIAACLGFEAFCGGEGVRVGMIIACRSLQLRRPWLQVGEQLDVHVERVRGSDHVSHFDGRVVDAAGAEVASATLTLVHGDRPPAE
jgi:predicted hotdog family 3-hydroxylacyl-ACP dehydratase